MIACYFITVSAFIQYVLTIFWRRSMRKRHAKAPDILPKELQQQTWVVMSVRGADPTLADSVKALLHQSFQHYKICIVVDNENDPAASVIRELAEEDKSHRLHVRRLKNPLSTCTLKCSAIAEGVEHVLNSDSDVSYFVMVDADSKPSVNLLAGLTGALHRHQEIGLASGNQWFEPDAPTNLGSLVRSMWYAGALFFSMLFQNPWAGAYAMRAKDIRKTDLLTVWRNSAVDDGPLKALLGRHGLGCMSLPSMITINREPCTLGFTTRWMSRILTWAKIHEPSFWLTFTQMLFSSALIVGILSTLGWALFLANWILVLACLVALVVSGVLSVLAWTTIRSCVRENLEADHGMNRTTPIRFFAALLTVIVAQAVYAVAGFRAAFAKSVSWRGIKYKVQHRSIVMEEYHPYQSAKQSNHSI